MTLRGHGYPAADIGTTAGRASLAIQKCPDTSWPFEPLNLLLFSVGDILFGIDADQVVRISAYQNETDDDLFWFHQEMGYGKKTVEYRSSTVITTRTKAGHYRVIIDSMEDIAEFNSDEISPLPTLLEQFALRRGIWGVLPRNGRMILLLDIDRLLRAKGSAEIDSKSD